MRGGVTKSLQCGAETGDSAKYGIGERAELLLDSASNGQNTNGPKLEMQSLAEAQHTCPDHKAQAKVAGQQSS